MDYPKSTPGIGLVDGLFVDENPTTGQPGSLIPAAWANALMAELLGVIKAAGIVPSEEDNAQLLHAIQSMALSDFKKSVRCATTGPIALSGLQTIDGVALAAGDRVLVKDQASASQNWIYVASGAAWARAQDADEGAECAPGHLIPVQAGTVNKLTVWQLTNTDVPVVGDTALTFRVVIGKQGTTLADYGITDAYTKTQTYTQAQVDDLLKNVNSMPVGSILPMPMATVPAGFLELDGSSQNIAAYPALAAYLGTTYNKGNEEAGFFRLPDTRGEFLRGWDHGRGVDAGRAIGSYQGDELRKHRHPQYEYDTGDTAVIPDGSLAGDLNLSRTIGTERTALIGYAGGAETRPRNLAVMWCIKAWSTPVNQGEIDIGALAVQVSAIQQRQKSLGDGQAWQDVKASRLPNTNYTNSTGRSIVVSASIAARAGDESGTIVVGGVVAAQTVNNGTAGEDFWLSAIVPNGAVYSVNAYTGLAIGIWSELR